VGNEIAVISINAVTSTLLTINKRFFEVVFLEGCVILTVLWKRFDLEKASFPRSDYDYIIAWWRYSGSMRIAVMAI
jgi:hypothetical protein